MNGWISITQANAIEESYLIPKANLSEEKEERNGLYLTKEQLIAFTEYFGKASHPKTRDYMDIFAVLALNDGISVHKISRLLGHGSVTVTEKVYAKGYPRP